MRLNPVLLVLSTVLLALPAGLEAQELSGLIKIDGSSTVYPITEAVAEEFARENPKVRVTVGISGTGGGFKKFLGKETEIQDASRPIKAAEEQAATAAAVSFIELPVAFDALTVVVNAKNDFITSMTVKELATLWAPEAQGKITRWNQLRPSWPDQPIRLFGPGVDSGTYDYFTEAIVGKEDSSRGDFTGSEDDNVLVQGVANDKYALGFFGLAYFEENQAKLRAVGIDDEKDENGKGPILPTLASVVGGQYQPLARPLFIYVREDSLSRPEIRAFVEFYLNNAADLVKETGYIPLPPEVYELARQRLQKKVLGSVYSGKGQQSGVPLKDLYASK